MNYSFTSSDFLNTSIIDDTMGRLVYEVSTPRLKLGNTTTTIRRPNGQVVAEYEPHFREDKVTLDGYTTTLSEWLPRKSKLSTDRVLTAPNGQVYVWKEKWNSGFKLLPADAPKGAEPVVVTQPTTLTGLFKSHKGGMTVHRELLPFLDAIVLSFIVCEKERQDRVVVSTAAAAS